MKDIIEANKYVELTYKVIDQKSGNVLTMVEFPLGYVHGVNEIETPQELFIEKESLDHYDTRHKQANIIFC